MNKTTMYIALGIIVIGIIFMFANQNKNTTKQNTTNTNAMEDTNTVPANTSSFSGTKNLDTVSSNFLWTAKKKVITSWVDTGTIKLSSGQAVFNNGELVSGKAVIDMNTINASTTGSGSGQDKLTTHVKSADFFDVATFPTSELVIDSVALGIAKGNLTIKGITKPIEFPITVNFNQDGSTVLSGTLTINRADFGVKFGSTSFFQNLGDKAIDDMFTIDFTVLAK